MRRERGTVDWVIIVLGIAVALIAVAAIMDIALLLVSGACSLA